jgi:hypothetical protein
LESSFLRAFLITASTREMARPDARVEASDASHPREAAS